MTTTLQTYNAIHLKGYLTKDAESTKDSVRLTKFRIGTDIQFTNNKGESSKKSSFPDIKLWRELAEKTKDLKKGDYIEVIGHLIANEKSESKDGKVYYNTYVEGNTILQITPKSAEKTA